MIPDSIILLTPEARLESSDDERLDALLYALEASRTRLRKLPRSWQPEELLDAHTAAWEAVHGELMNQLKGKD